MNVDDVRSIVSEVIDQHPLLSVKAEKEMMEMKEFKKQTLQFLNMDTHIANDNKMLDDFVRKQCAQVQANSIMMALEQS